MNMIEEESVWKIYYYILLYKALCVKCKKDLAELLYTIEVCPDCGEKIRRDRIWVKEKDIGPFTTYEEAEQWCETLPDNYAYNIEWNAEVEMAKP